MAHHSNDGNHADRHAWIPFVYSVLSKKAHLILHHVETEDFIDIAYTFVGGLNLVRQKCEGLVLHTSQKQAQQNSKYRRDHAKPTWITNFETVHIRILIKWIRKNKDVNPPLETIKRKKRRSAIPESQDRPRCIQEINSFVAATLRRKSTHRFRQYDVQSNGTDIRFPIGMKMPSEVHYVCPSYFSSRRFPPIATKSRSTADLSWSVLTSSGWFGTGNIRNVFSRPSPQTASFPLTYVCITPYFLPTMKPQTCCTLVFLLLPLHLKNSCTDNSSETAFRASCRQKVFPETFTRAIDAEKAHGLVNELSKVRTAIAVLWQTDSESLYDKSDTKKEPTMSENQPIKARRGNQRGKKEESKLHQLCNTGRVKFMPERFLTLMCQLDGLIIDMTQSRRDALFPADRRTRVIKIQGEAYTLWMLKFLIMTTSWLDTRIRISRHRCHSVTPHSLTIDLMPKAKNNNPHTTNQKHLNMHITSKHQNVHNRSEESPEGTAR
ncbi:hypothetical protein EAG_03331 [Camponotus floridanus]|uniref:Uncharacterized protein n=1 Tax=Camponotus floridanus TaxID=104421 RepID=E1ZWT2_CAMFO|nr:hypothetical protein EAG_03331 [Camponotus floridanus]